MFFVAAIASILLIRFFLSLTGYPSLGGASLHIAHLLWGGLLMVVALVLLFSYLSKRARILAALVGGIGFGTFIDELGKFITSDNDYFYRPTVALIYVCLVLLILASRSIRTGQRVTRIEYLINALQEMQEVALHDLDREEQMRVLRYLSRSDPGNPLVRPLQELVERSLLVPTPAPGLFLRSKRLLEEFYRALVRRPAFNRAVVAFFLLQQLVNVVYLVLALASNRTAIPQFLHLPIPGWGSQAARPMGAMDYADIVSNAVSASLVIVGVVRLPVSRLAAFLFFRRSVLISIFLTQVFSFYREQFWAVIGLGINILVWITLRYMISREHATEGASSSQDGPAADGEKQREP